MLYVHKSRAAKQSQKKQDEDELQKVLAKTPRLNRYFSRSTSASASTSSQIDEPSSADIGCSDYGENIDVATPEPVSEDFAVEAKFPYAATTSELRRMLNRLAKSILQM